MTAVTSSPATPGEVSVTEENVQELILAADMLELSDVVDICSAFLKQQLEPSNAIGIYRSVRPETQPRVCRVLSSTCF